MEKKGENPACLNSETILRMALLAGFGLAALLIGYLTFVAVRDFVAHWRDDQSARRYRRRCDPNPRTRRAPSR